MKVAARALSVFCPHCQKRASLEDLVIVGSHPGKSLMTCGDIRIERSARLHVEVYGNRVEIHGKLKGPVVANESVTVGATGHVVGDIRAPRITVMEGGLIEGRCEMTRVVESPVAEAASHDIEVPTPTEESPSPIRPRPLLRPEAQG